MTRSRLVSKFSPKNTKVSFRDEWRVFANTTFVKKDVEWERVQDNEWLDNNMEGDDDWTAFASELDMYPAHDHSTPNIREGERLTLNKHRKLLLRTGEKRVKDADDAMWMSITNHVPGGESLRLP
eukprot:8025491-Lingulodinium_polyedra.AAC.1